MAPEIKDILSNIINVESNWKIQLFQNWDSIIGDLGEQVQLEKVVGNTLVLGVYDSCWMQELYMLSRVLIKTINSKLDKPYIKNIRFKHTVRRKLENKKEKVESVEKKIELSFREEKTLEEIKDPELSAALRDFFIHCYKGKK